MTADHEPQIGSVVVDYTEIYYSENWKVKAQNGSNLVVLTLDQRKSRTTPIFL